MKNIILSISFFALLAFAMPVSAASWSAALAAAANAGNTGQIDIIAAENPADQGAIAMALLQQAQAKMASNPELASKIFAAAAAYVSQIAADQSAAAAAVIQALLNQAKDAAFQASNLEAAANIISAAVQMANAPNIFAAAAGLKADALAAADEFLSRNPQAPLKVRNLVSLAQTQGGGAPTVGLQGALPASAE